MALGIVGIKRGMTRVFTEDGESVPVTVIEAQPNRVTQLKTSESDGYSAVQVTHGSLKPSRVCKPAAGQFAKANVEAGRGLVEFRSDEELELAVGDDITLEGFEAGQKIDVTGVSKGKGFAGVMKRYNFSGGPAAHGSKFHRTTGSIGNRATPGKVWKGKKMAGRMGNRKRTVQSVLVYKVDADRNLLYVKGQVPGKAGRFLKITDALRKPPERPAYPAWGFGDFAEGAPSGVSVAKMKDPFITQSE